MTGVQTCALPIYTTTAKLEKITTNGITVSASGFTAGLDTDVNVVSRSEERRGGKECRSRWSPYL